MTTRDLTPWAVDETDALRDWIDNPQSMKQRELARRLERSLPSVRNKIAWLRGTPWSLRSTRPDYVPAGRNCAAAFQHPHPRANDCHKHLGLILETHRVGYPVCGGRSA